METKEFKETFLPYSAKMYRIAYRIIQDRDAAEDVVQDTFMKLWVKRHELSDIRSPESFTVVMLRNTCLDYLRKTKNDNFQEYESEIKENASLFKHIEQQDQIRYVKDLMEELPVLQRRIMQLKHWEGFSNEEIEEITGLTQGNVKMILSRARKIIKEKFNNWNN